MSCTSIAKWLCGVGKVFTDKDQAILCSKNSLFLGAFATIITLFVIIMASFITKSIPTLGVIGILCFALSFKYAETIPISEQEEDEREIQKRIRRGMTRDGAIDDLIEDRENICRAEDRARRDYRYRNNTPFTMRLG